LCACARHSSITWFKKKNVLLFNYFFKKDLLSEDGGVVYIKNICMNMNLFGTLSNGI